MSSRARIGIVVGAVVVLVVALVIASSGGDDNDKGSSGSAKTSYTVTVKDAKPVGGIQKMQFTKGGTIRFTVKSDTADEIHFHGYDVHKDVTAGGQVSFEVPATIEGKFVVELEDHKTQIAEVEVDPS